MSLYALAAIAKTDLPPPSTRDTVQLVMFVVVAIIVTVVVTTRGRLADRAEARFGRLSAVLGWRQPAKERRRSAALAVVLVVLVFGAILASAL